MANVALIFSEGHFVSATRLRDWSCFPALHGASVTLHGASVAMHRISVGLCRASYGLHRASNLRQSFIWASSTCVSLKVLHWTVCCNSDTLGRTPCTVWLWCSRAMVRCRSPDNWLDILFVNSSFPLKSRGPLKIRYTMAWILCLNEHELFSGTPNEWKVWGATKLHISSQNKTENNEHINCMPLNTSCNIK